MNTNEIISYDLSMSPNLEQIQRMLEKAFDKFTDLIRKYVSRILGTYHI